MPTRQCVSDGVARYRLLSVSLMVYDRVVFFRHICLMCRPPYVDDLSQTLNRCRTGCLSGNITINYLMYADDLVLLSPSATGLRELLCACEEFSISHDVVYNSKKS